MKQNLVKQIPALIPAGTKAINGATLYAAIIGATQGTPENIAADLNGLISARDNYELAKVTLTSARSAFFTKREMTRERIRIARDILKEYLGTEYNSNWDITGMNGSIMVPFSADDLLPIALGFKAHFTANQTHEVAAIQATAAAMQTLYDDLTTAQNAVITAEDNVEALLEVRNAKADRLYKRLRACIEELVLLLDPLDTRWTAYGFNKPGADESPESPENLIATLIGPTAVALKWDPAARAEYYRVFKKVIGVDEDYVAVGSPADLDFTLENLPMNATVEIQISAVNNGGESGRTTAVTVVTHA